MPIQPALPGTHAILPSSRTVRRIQSSCDVGMRRMRNVGGKVVRRGRPPKEAPKVPVTLRLDADLVEKLRAGGQGWQSRVNETLRKAAGL